MNLKRRSEERRTSKKTTKSAQNMNKTVYSCNCGFHLFQALFNDPMDPVNVHLCTPHHASYLRAGQALDTERCSSCHRLCPLGIWNVQDEHGICLADHSPQAHMTPACSTSRLHRLWSPKSPTGKYDKISSECQTETEAGYMQTYAWTQACTCAVIWQIDIPRTPYKCLPQEKWLQAIQHSLSNQCVSLLYVSEPHRIPSSSSNCW